jgi:hypothetical protein
VGCADAQLATIAAEAHAASNRVWMRSDRNSLSIEGERPPNRERSAVWRREEPWPGLREGGSSAQTRANSVQVRVQERSTAEPMAGYELVRWHASRQRMRHSGDD